MLNETSVTNHRTMGHILPITVSLVPGREQIAVLRPGTGLHSSTYRDLITEAKRLYDGGLCWILLDLDETPYIGSSGLVALHNIALMLQGQKAPDPEYGWQAIHALERGIGQGAEKRLKVFKAQPRVAQRLSSPPFSRFLEIHADLDSAVASCGQPCSLEHSRPVDTRSVCYEM